MANKDEPTVEYTTLLAQKHMVGIDHLPADKWQERVNRLTPDDLQRELLRQATDTKLQLVSILNALHLIALITTTACAIAAAILWRVW